MISVILADPTGGILTAGILGLATAGASYAASRAAKPGAPSTPGAITPATPAGQPSAPPAPTQTTGPSFLAAAAAPPQVNQPGKTLLGQ